MDVTTTNDPAVVAEIAGVFAAYEQALVDNDVQALEEAFWDSALTVRFGLAERLYGRREIDAWRDSATRVPVSRTLGRTVIVAFGEHAACVSTEFRDETSEAVGRQSQTWLRLDGRWRIVAAHVSREPE